MNEDLLDGSELVTEAAKRSALLLILIILSIVANLVALIFAMDQIRSIVVSGPLVFIIGATVLTIGYLKRRSHAIIQGILTIGIPFVVFLAILIGQLSPNEAKKVILFPLMIAIGLHLIYSIFCITRESKIER